MSKSQYVAVGLANCLPEIRYAADAMPVGCRLEFYDAVRAELARLEAADASDSWGLWQYDEYPACNPLAAQR